MYPGVDFPRHRNSPRSHHWPLVKTLMTDTRNIVTGKPMITITGRLHVITFIVTASTFSGFILDL